MQGQRASVRVLAGNLVMAAAKYLAGALSGSAAMMADALHTASDAVTTVGVIVGLQVAKRPADEDHPYGHGRAESVVAKLLGIILIIVAASVMTGAIGRILRHEYEVPGILALWAAVVSILVKEAMARYTAFVGKTINSPAMLADAWHQRSDALSSVAAFIGILGARNGFLWMDPAAAVVVAIMIGVVGSKIVMASVHEMMDRQSDRGFADRVAEIARSVVGVQAVHGVAVRWYGAYAQIDLRIGVYPATPVADGHEIGRRVQQRIRSEINQVSNVFIHLNPAERGEG
ncbi:MAG: cation diffusion facilitator family transporter [Bacillota bacterium]